MIIYNVTANVDHSIAEAWLKWMKEVHIKSVLDTDCFTGYKILRLINESSDATGLTYAVQYFAPDMKTMSKYASQYAPGLQQEVFLKYGERVVSFRTLLEEV